MPMHAKAITMAPKPTHPPPPDVSRHVAKIDAMLSAPWYPWELVDGDSDHDHAGRVYPDYPERLTVSEAAELARIYREHGWEVRGPSPSMQLCFVPASRR